MLDVKTNTAVFTADSLNPVEPQETASEILELLPKENINPQPQSSPKLNDQAAGNPPAASLPFPDLPGLGFKWLPTTDKNIINKRHKVFLDHTKLLAAGTPVEKIEDETFGRWRGCQCAKCKTKRNEFRSEDIAGGDPLAGPKAMGSFITEKFFGRFLCLPNETMKAVVRFKKLPKEAEECWNVPAEDVKIYEEFGKFVMENYLNLENYKHAQLIAFGFWYGTKFAASMAVMNAMISKEVKK